MALLKLSPLVEKISGKISGFVFGFGQSGQYVRSNSWSNQPNSPSQSIQRNEIGQITQIWRSLSESERETWAAQSINYPRTNNLEETYFLSAYSLFCFLNLNRQVLNLAPLISAPTFVAISESTLFALNASTFSFTVQVDPKISANWVQVWSAPHSTSSIIPHHTTFRYLGAFENSFTSDLKDFESAYVALFGTKPVGSFAFIALKDVVSSTGLPSPLHSFSFAEVSF